MLAAHAALRATVTPAGRGSKGRGRTCERATPKHVALNWTRRLKRVFGIEIEQCARCGGRLEVIASIEQPELIERILHTVKASAVFDRRSRRNRRRR